MKAAYLNTFTNGYQIVDLTSKETIIASFVENMKDTIELFAQSADPKRFFPLADGPFSDLWASAVFDTYQGAAKQFDSSTHGEWQPYLTAALEEAFYHTAYLKVIDNAVFTPDTPYSLQVHDFLNESRTQDTLNNISNQLNSHGYDKEQIRQELIDALCPVIAKMSREVDTSSVYDAIDNRLYCEIFKSSEVIDREDPKYHLGDTANLFELMQFKYADFKKYADEFNIATPEDPLLFHADKHQNLRPLAPIQHIRSLLSQGVADHSLLMAVYGKVNLAQLVKSNPESTIVMSGGRFGSFWLPHESFALGNKMIYDPKNNPFTSSLTHMIDHKTDYPSAHLFKNNFGEAAFILKEHKGYTPENTHTR